MSVVRWVFCGCKWESLGKLFLRVELSFWREYRVEVVRPHGKEENRSQLGPTATRGGLGTIHENWVVWTRFWVSPRDHWCCGMRLMMLWDETRKSSSLDSFFIHRNQVQRTRFICIKNESNELGFLAYKPSPMNSVSRLTNRVQWTRFLAYVDTLATSVAGKIIK